MSFEITSEMIEVKDFELDDPEGTTFSSYLCTYFDIDKKFGVDTSCDDKYINFYGIYNSSDKTISSKYIICNDENEDQVCIYVPTENEKEIIFNEMDRYCIKEYGMSMEETASNILKEVSFDRIQKGDRAVESQINVNAEPIIYVAIFNHFGKGYDLLNIYSEELTRNFPENCSVSLINGDTLCFYGLSGQEISELMESTGADYNYSYDSPEDAWNLEGEIKSLDDQILKASLRDNNLRTVPDNKEVDVQEREFS